MAPRCAYDQSGRSEAISDLVKYRVSRALESISEARILADSFHWNACVNRLYYGYYACFYAVSALLVLHQMNSKKHSGIRSFFNLHFVKTGIVSIASARI
ncbi:MAG: HEPN domain-containing protein [Chitinivibrionales bacterium]